MSRSIGWAVGVILASATLSGCHHHRGINPAYALAGGDSNDSANTVFLEVENHNWSDVEISVNHDGRIERLIHVTAAKNATIPLPRRLHGETGNIRMIARRIGGTDVYVSPLISIKTGLTVRFTIEDALVRSSVGVW